MRLNVNPTRMELRRLKDKLKTAVKGHKLLKDKSDEMIRQFMDIVRENKAMRKNLEADLADALNSFMLARASSDETALSQALMMPSVSVEMECSTKNIMGVDVPLLTLTRKGDINALPYAFSSVTAELDSAIIKISAIMEKLLRLAEIEKCCNMLADEIVKNRRRVNALEYVLIPNYEETIKYIMMKLDENERSTQIRLMKVKSMITQQ
ncbi:MAG: V-type ATP synthase subunit D [Clostridia bacterium]|nr:V-type ATP synthase subunit D [Clostridia bacterium]MBP5649328.1 V-type ATP synthase subunit D [Clostridia bacterium]